MTILPGGPSSAALNALRRTLPLLAPPPDALSLSAGPLAALDVCTSKTASHVLVRFDGGCQLDINCRQR